jgi:hypothetical protein
MGGGPGGLKLAELMPIYGDVPEEMQDPGLTPAARLKYHNLETKLIHDMNETTGQLPTRSVIESVDANRTYPSDLPRRRTKCDAEIVKGVVTVICLLEVDAHEIWLLVAASVVLIALVEPDVANQVPPVARAVPSCSTPVLEFLGVE